MHDLKEYGEEQLLELSHLLQMEISEKTDPSEIAAKLTEDVIESVEKTNIAEKAESLGGSKIRSIRVVYSLVITALYDKIVKNHPERIVEIFPYIEGRIRDKDRRIRQHVVSFVFRNVTALTSENINLHIITKTIIDLLKNRNKQVRFFYLKMISSNTNAFAEMMSLRDVKYLVNTMALLCECYQQEKRPIAGFMRRAVAICARLKYLGKLQLIGMFPLFEACDFSSAEILPFVQKLYKRCEKELVNTGFIRTLEEHRERNKHGYIYRNLLLLLQHGLNQKLSIFEKYSADVYSIDVEETQLHIFKLLRESKYNTNPSLFLSDVKNMFNVLPERKSLDLCEILLAAYFAYVQEGLVSLGEFKDKVIYTFKTEKHSKQGILSFLDSLVKTVQMKNPQQPSNSTLGAGPSTLNPSNISTARITASLNNQSEVFSLQSINLTQSDLLQEEGGLQINREGDMNTNENYSDLNKSKEVIEKRPSSEVSAELAQTLFSLIKEILHHLVEHKEEELELFLNYFNPFEYSTGLPLYSITNTVTFYCVLWYVHTIQPQSTLPDPCAPTSVQIQKITHCDFDISLEFYSVLYILAETSSQFMSTLKDEMFVQISVYIESALSSIRGSRDYLLSNYNELSYSIDGLISQLDKKNCTEKATQQILKHNISSVVSLLLYLLNAPNTQKNMQAIKEHACTVQIKPADIEIAKKYGIISAKTMRKFEKFMSMTSKETKASAAEIDLSSVTEHSISTNLDTNIIEGMSKIDDNK
ncbi:hypothetical protein NERG_01081 [Nematocida ausubeli]|uniref:Uncharacterized protein n=1 Tax=Nematocida ausubeli (strain ATCC PRA-371 / ERTm2) TaxID=1913371 RepID=H8ZCT4_NEMA1|nr:hypothetical protein NERG_01081 [Nematocida ausubeli]